VVVLHKLALRSPLLNDDQKDSLIADYYLNASQGNIRVLVNLECAEVEETHLN
jgi:hypothetical protein